MINIQYVKTKSQDSQPNYHAPWHIKSDSSNESWIIPFCGYWAGWESDKVHFQDIHPQPPERFCKACLNKARKAGILDYYNTVTIIPLAERIGRKK